MPEDKSQLEKEADEISCAHLVDKWYCESKDECKYKGLDTDKYDSGIVCTRRAHPDVAEVLRKKYADDKLRRQQEPKAEEPIIDPSTSRHTEHNLDAAKTLGAAYSKKAKGYVFENDPPSLRFRQLDRFGQPLG